MKKIKNLVLLIFFISIVSFVYCNYIRVEVNGDSMNPTLISGDKIIVRKCFLNIKRGDIILSRDPANEGEFIIKRVIGLPGDHVSIKKSKIYCNDLLYNEKYINEGWKEYNYSYEYDVPQDSYIVLGDNRNGSIDSRRWPEIALKNRIVNTQNLANSYSYLDKDNVIGVVILRYYPKVQIY